MKEEKSFLDELLEKAEKKEQQLLESHLDLILIEIRKLEEQIEKNFDTAAQEREIIKNWALERNSLLSGRIEWLSKKLELFLKEEKLKTLDLPNGIIRIRKKSEKVLVVDEEKFFKNATSQLLNIIPETSKPDLLKIRTWIKRTGRIPDGVEVSTQEDKFSYTIKRNNNGKEEVRATDKHPSKSAIFV
ncbi:MAG: host-nuclease inhibitor Gam family protein [Ignavibacteria bacterium]|nr:host-nuclease inhibitor Gam family protein [Ignavibacteria bacterium]